MSFKGTMYKAIANAFVAPKGNQWIIGENRRLGIIFQNAEIASDDICNFVVEGTKCKD